MNILQAAELVLEEAQEPLHYRDIMQCILARQLWTTQGETPDQTLNAKLSLDIKDHGAASLFQRTAPGYYALRRWGLPEVSPSSDGHNGSQDTTQEAVIVCTGIPMVPLSFTDATMYILENYAQGQPMHYRDITRKALELGLIKTSGLTPEATLYAQVLTEIGRWAKRGEEPRFVKEGKGFIGLTSWTPVGLPSQIEQHNQEVRQQLHTRLSRMSPREFEALVGELLVALGFDEVVVTSYSHDGGIDVQGTLAIGDVIRLHMAVQVKRWKHNVHAPTVQQLRGTLRSPHQGLIITTSDFSSGARKEAECDGKVPIALMNGDQLVALLVEHDIGVRRTSYDLIELGEDQDE
jgi:Restriction endonuclease